MIAVQNLKGEIIQLIFSRKEGGGGMYLVSATPTKLLIEFFIKLYTVVVHNLQMCMKEYCCCLKFRRGDNSTYTFTKRGGCVPCKRNSS